MIKYLLNTFILLLPVLIWNAAWASELPKSYSSPEIWDAIPGWVSITENVLRIIVFLSPLLLKLSFETPLQRAGLLVYGLGLLVYFASWWAQLYYPHSTWSDSLPGHMAPAYTSLVFLVGIGMIGQQALVPIPKAGMIYLAVALLFVAVHSYHSYLAYQNI